MAKRKPRKSSGRTPIRVRLLIAGLILIVIAGIAAIKFLETPKGKAYLLDAGFTGYYVEVQDTIDAGLQRAVGELGLEGNLQIKNRPVEVGGRNLASRSWSTRCSQSCSLFQINLALTHAVTHAGGVVRSSRELSDGTTLLLEAGSRKYTTHRIEVRQFARLRDESAAPEPRARAPRPKLALVIDDFGYSKDETVEAFFVIDLPLTLSVIPELRYSRHALSHAIEAGKQVILHLPMEAEETGTPTDVPAVGVSMTDAEITALVNEYLETAPEVIGVNNHQGSLATQDSALMSVVLGVVGARNLFFFDSLTSPKSIAYNTAKRLGVPTARNDLFIDADTEEPEVVEARIERLLEIARNRGFAIGIGHPRRWTLEALRLQEQTLKHSDVEMVFLSTLID